MGWTKIGTLVGTIMNGTGMKETQDGTSHEVKSQLDGPAAMAKLCRRSASFLHERLPPSAHFIIRVFSAGNPGGSMCATFRELAILGPLCAMSLWGLSPTLDDNKETDCQSTKAHNRRPPNYDKPLWPKGQLSECDAFNGWKQQH